MMMVGFYVGTASVNVHLFLPTRVPGSIRQPLRSPASWRLADHRRDQADRRNDCGDDRLPPRPHLTV